MNSIEVPDWVVDEALFCTPLHDGDELAMPIDLMRLGSPETLDRARSAMRAALTAALGAWVVPAGYQETITVQDDGVFADIERKLWHWIPGKPIPESTADTFREPIFTLRQEKPE